MPSYLKSDSKNIIGMQVSQTITLNTQYDFRIYFIRLKYVLRLKYVTRASIPQSNASIVFSRSIS